MAELPNLGKHCNFASCKQLDFLPFTCDGCTRTFCSEHRVKDIHGCTAENVVAASGEYKGEKGYSCSVADCKNRELTPIWCMKCQLSFCLSHRHAQDHQCSKLGTNKTDTNISKTAEHVNKILETKKAAPKKSKPLNAKASKTAARVALMKMKMTAVGDGSCPEEERLYLKVLPPQGSNTQSQTMFFSKVWSVGRVIDNISDRLKLTNNNNVENAKKLRLFSTLTGDLYPTDCDVGSLLQGELLYSGSSVILEYVDNDCTCISDLTLYSAS